MEKTVWVVEVSHKAEGFTSMSKFSDAETAWRFSDNALFGQKGVTVKVARVPRVLFDANVGPRSRAR